MSVISCNSFISEKYNIIYQSSRIEKPEDAKFFVLAEWHNADLPGDEKMDSIIQQKEQALKCQMTFEEKQRLKAEMSEKKAIAQEVEKLNAALIERYSEKNSLLCLENRPSMEDIELPYYVAMARQIFPNEQALLALNCPKEVIAQIPCLPDGTINYEVFLRMFPMVKVMMSKFVFTNFRSQFPIITEASSNNITGIHGWDLPSNEKVDNEFTEPLAAEGVASDGTYGSILSSIDKMGGPFFLSEEARVVFFNLMDSKFPARTKSMVSTMRLVNEITFVKKCFLPAGAEHVKCGRPHDPRRSLDLLYQTLEELNGVALLPKILGSGVPFGDQKPLPVVQQEPKFISQASATHEVKPIINKTRILARYDVGFGNKLFVRGEGSPLLNWNRGMEMVCIQGPDLWALELEGSDFTNLKYKILINDAYWEKSNDHEIKTGQQQETKPIFL